MGTYKVWSKILQTNKNKLILRLDLNLGGAVQTAAKSGTLKVRNRVKERVNIGWEKWDRQQDKTESAQVFGERADLYKNSAA